MYFMAMYFIGLVIMFITEGNMLSWMVMNLPELQYNVVYHKVPFQDPYSLLSTTMILQQYPKAYLQLNWL